MTTTTSGEGKIRKYQGNTPVIVKAMQREMLGAVKAITFMHG